MSIEDEGTDGDVDTGLGIRRSKDKVRSCGIGFREGRCRVKYSGEGRGVGGDRAKIYAEAGSETVCSGSGRDRGIAKVEAWEWHRQRQEQRQR